MAIGLLLALCVASCGGPRDPLAEGKAHQAAIAARDAAATREADAVEAELTHASTLAPAERERHLRGLRRQLETFLARATGTPIENKALYYLADWTFEFPDAAEDPRGDRVLALLDRLQRTGDAALAFRSLGRALHARVLLRQGRLADARAMATQLAADIPEYRSILALVEFHARLGQRVPRSSGALLRGRADPLAGTEPFLLYCFVGDLDAPTAYWLEQRLRTASPGTLRLIVVTHASNALTATSRFGALPGADEADLHWADPARDLADWQRAWNLPYTPCSALIGPGPDRRIMAIEPPPSELAAAAKPVSR